MGMIRQKWSGAAAIVVQEDKLLMIKSKDTGSWSVPSGGLEAGESPEAACLRETFEETGFQVRVKQLVNIKNVAIAEYDVTTHYYLCEIVGGQITYHDPDDSIEEIDWKKISDFDEIEWMFEEDKERINNLVTILRTH